MKAEDYLKYQLRDFPDQEEYNQESVDAICAFMEGFAKHYHAQKTKLNPTGKWVKYDWEDKDSRPPEAGRYLLYRQSCDKMHFEQWNGGGWASSNNKEGIYWCSPSKPDK